MYFVSVVVNVFESWIPDSHSYLLRLAHLYSGILEIFTGNQMMPIKILIIPGETI